MPGDVEVEVDPKDLRDFLQAVKGFSPALARTTRRRIRTVGKTMVDAIKEELVKAPPGGGLGSNHGVRQKLADGTKVVIATGVRRQGIRIETSGAKLPDAQRAMLRAYNKKSFRHPGIGNPDVWFTQEGRPYFGSVIKKHEHEFVRAVEEALGDALQEMRLA